MSLLSESESMWNGILGKITTGEHHIDLKPDSGPSPYHRYLTGLKTRQQKVQKTDVMSKEGMTKWTMWDWARHMVFGLKKDEKLRFYVVYKRPNAGIVRETASLPRLYDGNSSLEEAPIYAIFDCSSEY